MKKLLNFKYIALLLVVLLIVGWFYWFQFRPSEIRKECSAYAKEKLNRAFDENSVKSANEADTLYDLYFKYCTDEKGLK